MVSADTFALPLNRSFLRPHNSPAWKTLFTRATDRAPLPEIMMNPSPQIGGCFLPLPQVVLVLSDAQRYQIKFLYSQVKDSLARDSPRTRDGGPLVSPHGFVRNSITTAFMAWTVMGTSPWSVTENRYKSIDDTIV